MPFASNLPAGALEARVWKPRDDQVDAFGLTHPGKVRRENQDHFLLGTLHKTLRIARTSLPDPEVLEFSSERVAVIAAVADGVGGSRAGGEASRAAVETVAAFLSHTMDCYYRTDPSDQEAFFGALSEAADCCHRAVVERAKERGREGMATTLTMGIGVWPFVYTLHVGDSRFYQLRDGVLTQITRDQTMAQELVDCGSLAPDAVTRSPFAHVLSSAIGAANQPVLLKNDLKPGDVNLLCTDGLTKHVSDDRIRERLSTMTSAEQACRALVEDALAAGGTDNITVVVARPVGGPEPERSFPRPDRSEPLPDP